VIHSSVTRFSRFSAIRSRSTPRRSESVGMKIALHTLKSHPYLAVSLTLIATLAYGLSLALHLLKTVQ